VKTLRRPLFLALALVVMAAGLAGIRQFQRVQERLPVDFEIVDRHHLDWDPTTGVFTVTGSDPHGTVNIPAGTFPLDELRLEFTGDAQPGGWYVYASPEHLPLRLDQDQVVTAVAEPTLTGHALVWTMEASLLARIDFPDELTVPMTLERVQFTSRYASSSSVVYWAAIISALLAGLILVWLALRPLLPFAPVFWIIALGLVAAKLWLASGLGLSVQAHMQHDDKLFVEQAMSIAAGNWLGPFGQLTLAKGPTYSVFLALSSLTGVSVQLNEILLHGSACLIFVAAVSPWLRRAEWRLLLLIVLLFEPHSLSSELIGRVLRGAIQPALTLLTLAGLIGMVVRAEKSARFIWPWALLTGIAGTAFWYSREEGIWLAPTVLLLLTGFIFAGWNRSSASRSAWLACALLPVVLFIGGRLMLRAINYAYYEVPMGVDVTEGAFPAAYGAMLRVTAPDPLPVVPVTSGARKLIYPHSPAFAELEWALEGPLTRSWGRAGWPDDPDNPRALQEIRGGWFQWALREAATSRGHYASAPAAEDYWQQVADEINAAVDRGKIPGSPPRHGFFPVWHDSYTLEVVKGWFKSLDLVVRFTHFGAHGIASAGDPADISRHAAFLNVTPVLTVPPTDQDSRARMIVRSAFAFVGWPLTLLALFATGVIARRIRHSLSARFYLTVLLSLWGGATALLLVVSLVHVTSFSAIAGNYLGPCVPLIVSCWILAPVWAWGQSPESSPINHS